MRGRATLIRNEIPPTKNTLPLLAARGCRHRQKFHPAKEDHFQLMWRLYRDFGVADQNTEFGNHGYLLNL